MASQRIHVAVAVIVNKQQQVLIALRQAHQHQGNLWEFPGGKVEASESVEAAVRREIKEEVGLNVEQAERLIDLQHTYEDKAVRLDVWLVTKFSGQATGREGQKIVWSAMDELHQYDFPEANQTIIEKLTTRLRKGEL